MWINEVYVSINVNPFTAAQPQKCEVFKQGAWTWSAVGQLLPSRWLHTLATPTWPSMLLSLSTLPTRRVGCKSNPDLDDGMLSAFTSTSTFT